MALHVVLGYSLPEVARSTAVPLNTVKSRLRLAKQALRRELEAECNHELDVHPDDLLHRARGDGALSRDEQAYVDAHVQDCRTCRFLLDAGRAFDAEATAPSPVIKLDRLVARTLRRTGMDRGRRSRQPSRRLAAAGLGAALMLGGVAFAGYWGMHHPAREPAPLAASVAPTPVRAPRPARKGAPAPSAPDDYFPAGHGHARATAGTITPDAPAGPAARAVPRATRARNARDACSRRPMARAGGEMSRRRCPRTTSCGPDSAPAQRPWRHAPSMPAGCWTAACRRKPFRSIGNTSAPAPPGV